MQVRQLCKLLRFAPSSTVKSSLKLASIAVHRSPLQMACTCARSQNLSTGLVELLSDVSAMQGQDGLHMVSVVEAMLYAAEEHDRLLLDSAHERLHHPEDCMFDIDLPAAVFCQ